MICFRQPQKPFTVCCHIMHFRDKDIQARPRILDIQDRGNPNRSSAVDLKQDFNEHFPLRYTSLDEILLNETRVSLPKNDNTELSRGSKSSWWAIGNVEYKYREYHKVYRNKLHTRHKRATGTTSSLTSTLTIRYSHIGNIYNHKTVNQAALRVA